FVKELTSDQPEPPLYFAQMKQVNKTGLPRFEVKDIEVGTPTELVGQVFDLRDRETFCKGFIKGSINIPYNSKFLQFIGWFIDYDAPMTVITDPAHAVQLQKDLASIGYDDLQLIVPSDQVDSYVNDSYESVSPESFVQNYTDKNILDVRTTAEYNDGHLENATHIHYGHLQNSHIPFAKDDNIFVHCQSGVRSAIAMSVLRKLGYTNVFNVSSGYNGISAALN